MAGGSLGTITRTGKLRLTAWSSELVRCREPGHVALALLVWKQRTRGSRTAARHPSAGLQSHSGEWQAFCAQPGQKAPGRELAPHPRQTVRHELFLEPLWRFCGREQNPRPLAWDRAPGPAAQRPGAERALRGQEGACGTPSPSSFSHRGE